MAPIQFKKAAILGGGLLGGSLALRLNGHLDCSLWARRKETVDAARELGLQGASSDLEEVLTGADLVVLSVPVGAMPDLVQRAIDDGLSKNSLLTDVGSVKSSVHQALGPILKSSGLRFIGGHPMAGSERQGIGFARSDLFEGAMCLLTDEDEVGDPWSRSLEEFWKSVGCRTHWLSARAHDDLVARISHLPHVMSAATAWVSLENPADAGFGGGGLRDTTRVAAGDPSMWAEILMENSASVLGPIRAARDSLGEMLAMLERGDHEALRQWLEAARKRHQAGKERRNDEFEK